MLIRTGHYVCYNIHEDGVTKFSDARTEYFSSLNEDAMVKRNTHILFYMRSDKFSTEHTYFSTLHNVDVVGIKNVLRILFENAEMPFLQKSDIEKCIYNKLNSEIINSYCKLLESRKTNVISFSSFLFHDLCKSEVPYLLKIVAVNRAFWDKIISNFQNPITVFTLFFIFKKVLCQFLLFRSPSLRI